LLHTWLHNLQDRLSPTDPSGLDRLIGAWPSLAEPIRRVIVAIVDAIPRDSERLPVTATQSRGVSEAR